MRNAETAAHELKRLHSNMGTVNGLLNQLGVARVRLKNVLRSIRAHGFISGVVTDTALNEVDGVRALCEDSTIKSVMRMLAREAEKREDLTGIPEGGHSKASV